MRGVDQDRSGNAEEMLEEPLTPLTPLRSTTSMSRHRARSRINSADEVGPRILPLRTVPLSILIQSFLVAVILIVAASISTLIISYALRVIDPITTRYCGVLSQNVADEVTTTLSVTSNALDFVRSQFEAQTTRVDDILVQCQEFANWIFDSVYFMNATLLIAAEKNKTLLIRNVTTGQIVSTEYVSERGRFHSDTLIPDVNFSQRLWPQNESTLGHTQWTKVYTLYSSGKPGITVYYHNALGVFSIDLEINYLESLIHNVTNLHSRFSKEQSQQLHPEVGIFDTQTRKWLAKSSGSRVLDRIADADLPRNRFENCDRTITVDKENYFVNCEVVGALTLRVSDSYVAVSVLLKASVLSYLLVAIRNVVLLVGGAAIVILLFSAVLVRFIARPFRILSKRMRAVSHMKGFQDDDKNRFKIERARFREIDEMQSAFEEIILQLNKLKNFTPDNAVEDQTETTFSETWGASSNVTVMDSDKLDKVNIALKYISRSNAMEKKNVNFLFKFKSNEGNIFEDLVRECLNSVGEHLFQDVKLEAEIPGEEQALTLQNSKQFEDVLVLSPYELHLNMYKSSTRNLLTPAMAVIDTANVIATLVFTVQVLTHATDSEEEITGTTFVFLYVFALVGNLLIGFHLLRDYAEQERMYKWITSQRLEVGITLFLSMLNTQNIQLLWSNLRITKLLYFNAPRSPELQRRSVIWSLFGFVFCDLMQLAFKVYILTKSGFSRSVLISIGTSSVAVGFNLIKKFAVLSLIRGGNASTNSQRTPRHRRETKIGMSALRVRSVSLMLVVWQPPHSMSPLALHSGLELNRMYEMVFAITKQNMGSIISFSNGEILIAFNAANSTEWPSTCHIALAGVPCAISLSKALRAVGIAACICLTSEDTCVVGLLGSSSRRSFHCFASTQRMHRMAALAGWLNADIVCTQTIHNAFQRDPKSVSNARTVHIDTLYDRVEMMQDSSTNLYEVLYEGKGARVDAWARVDPRFRPLGKIFSALGFRRDFATQSFAEKLVADVEARMRKTNRIIEAEEIRKAAALAAQKQQQDQKPQTAAGVKKLLGDLAQGPGRARSNRRMKSEAVPQLQSQGRQIVEDTLI